MLKGFGDYLLWLLLCRKRIYQGQQENARMPTRQRSYKRTCGMQEDSTENSRHSRQFMTFNGF